MLATLLYHALRRGELCRLKVKDFKHERRGVAHLKVSGKGGKTRYVPLHPAASGLIADYLDAAGHGDGDAGALFRPLHNSRGEGVAAMSHQQGHSLLPDVILVADRSSSDQMSKRHAQEYRHQPPHYRW
jgi:integrase